MTDDPEQHGFRSTAIASATYDKDTQELVVVFTSGKSYSFDGIPPDLWEEMKVARSIGQFYNSRIRGVY